MLFKKSKQQKKSDKMTDEIKYKIINEDSFQIGYLIAFTKDKNKTISAKAKQKLQRHLQLGDREQ